METGSLGRAGNRRDEPGASCYLDRQEDTATTSHGRGSKGPTQRDALDTRSSRARCPQHPGKMEGKPLTLVLAITVWLWHQQQRRQKQTHVSGATSDDQVSVRTAQEAAEGKHLGNQRQCLQTASPTRSEYPNSKELTQLNSNITNQLARFKNGQGS